jgi:hypothetical protein
VPQGGQEREKGWYEKSHECLDSWIWKTFFVSRGWMDGWMGDTAKKNIFTIDLQSD